MDERPGRATAGRGRSHRLPKLARPALALGLVALALAGCREQPSLLDQDPRIQRLVEDLGTDEAIARAETRAKRENSAAAHTDLAATCALSAGRLGRGSGGTRLAKLARQNLAQALELDPLYPPAVIAEGALRLGEGRVAEAAQLMRGLVASRPEAREGWELLARALMDQGQYREAETALRQGLTHAPKAPRLHARLADALLAQRRVDEARQAASRAMALGPRLPQVLLSSARVMLAAGDRDQAAKLALRAAALGPDSSEAHFDAGNILYGAGLADQAIAQYAAAAILDPASPVAANNLALALADAQRDTGAAVAWARKALVAGPRSREVRDTLGWALARDGQHEDAVRMLRAVRREWPDNPAVAYHLGWALAQTRNRAEGLTFLREAARGPRPEVATAAREALREPPP